MRDAPIVVAALILAFAFLGGSVLIKSSLDRGAGEISALRTALTEAGAVVQAARPAPAPSRGNRPDPNRRYDIEVGAAPVKGPKDAKVTIVEWSDFQCPFCGRVTPTLARIHQEYGDQVQIAFKHLPLASIHPQAAAAHAAAEAAHRQGKFWEMHDQIFAKQREMSPAKFVEYARALDLDMDQFQEDVASAEVKQRIDGDLRTASRLGVSSTPSFFVNGRYIAGAQPFDTFKRMIDAELAAN